jgi:hypothetical protein
MADISMSDSELLAIPASVPLVVAARPFGLGRNKAYELARSGEFPCPVIRVGERYRVNRAVLYEALNFDPVAAATRLAITAGSPLPELTTSTRPAA